MSLYFGFDPGKNFGYAVLNEHGHRLESGTLVLKNDKAWEGGGIRFLRLRSLLLSLFRRHGVIDVDQPSVEPGQVLDLFQERTSQGVQGLRPALVSYEKVYQQQKSGTAAALYYGCIATLTLVCEEYDIPYQGFGVSALKKTATGRGNAGKADMMDACLEQWQHDPDDDNEADALWAAETGRRSIR